MCSLNDFPKKDFKYLIHGICNSGKTVFINNISKFLTNHGRYPIIIQGSLIENFFKISLIEESITIPIENKYITINFSESGHTILPIPGSEEYKSIFIKKKYRDEKKFLSCKNPVILIDDCDKVKLKTIKLIEKAFRLIFQNKFFGGLDLLFIGNENNTYPENIFFSILYKEKDNLYKEFEKKNIINNKNKFSELFPNIVKYRRNPLHFSNQLTKENISFIKSKKVKTIENRKLYSDDCQIIEELNKKMTENLGNIIYKFTPILKYTNKDLFYYIEKKYKSKLKLQYFSIGQKVYYETNKSFYKINSFKFSETNKEEIIGILLEDVDKNTLLIEPKTIIDKNLQIEIKRFPIIPSYCLHIFYLTDNIKQGIFFLTENTSIENFERAVNKIDNIFFHYTIDIEKFSFNVQMLKTIHSMF